MTEEELGLLEYAINLAVGECAYDDIDSIQKLEDKIKIIGNLCKKQKEAIDKAIEFANEHWGSWCAYHLEYMTELLDILKEVLE